MMMQDRQDGGHLFQSMSNYSKEISKIFHFFYLNKDK